MHQQEAIYLYNIIYGFVIVRLFPLTEMDFEFKSVSTGHK